MHPEYARRYRELYAKHWWWRAREALILDELARLYTPGSGGTILDVGCGDGLLFEELARFGPVEGVEMDPTGVSPGGRWVDRIHVRPFDQGFAPGKSYALVLMLDVLEHFAEPVPALARAVDLLDAGGAILVTVPAFPAQWTSHDEINRHFTRYTRASLLELARASGARVERSRYFFQWTSPIKLVVRLKEAVLGGEPAPPRLPPRWLNALFYALSRIEQKAVSVWPVPFGSSLLAVLRRDGDSSL